MSLLAMVAAQVLNICTLATVDRESATTRECLTCHDGTVSQGIPVHEKDSHPADVNYLDAWLRQRSSYKLVASDSNLVFPGGKITCTTCHDARGGTPKGEHWLARSNAGSGLCFTCHQM